jgi:hypothetical protein
VHRAGDAVEPGVEGGDDLGWRTALGERREAAQVGEQQRRLDGLAHSAPQGSSQHPRGAAAPEIGFERRIQRGSGGERGEGRGGEARGLMQPFGVVGGEQMRRDPAEPRPVRFRADKVFMHRPARKARKPAPAGFARLAFRSRRRKRAASKPQRLDHFAAVGSPKPGAPGDQWVGRRECERAAGERRAILDQAMAQRRQKKLRRGRVGGRVHQPREG